MDHYTTCLNLFKEPKTLLHMIFIDRIETPPFIGHPPWHDFKRYPPFVSPEIWMCIQILLVPLSGHQWIIGSLVCIGLLRDMVVDIMWNRVFDSLNRFKQVGHPWIIGSLFCIGLVRGLDVDRNLSQRLSGMGSKYYIPLMTPDIWEMHFVSQRFGCASKSYLSHCLHINRSWV